jgi:hypothetical protein
MSLWIVTWAPDRYYNYGPNNALWGHGVVKSVYDPCPSGWRVPSFTDMYTNYSPWQDIALRRKPTQDVIKRCRDAINRVSTNLSAVLSITLSRRDRILVETTFGVSPYRILVEPPSR